MPSTTFCPSAAVAPQSSEVLHNRGKKPTPADLLRLTKAPGLDTKKEACKTLRAHNIFLKRLGNAPKLTCRLPFLHNRNGRCYELAFRGCLQGHEWTVIHGETIGPYGIGRMSHAWLENDGWVYDPVLDRTMRSDAYVLLVAAVVFKRFTVWEASDEAVKCGHYGPW